MSDKKVHTSRISAYKSAGSCTGELRRKRAEVSVALRKQARDDQLLKRRAMSPENEKGFLDLQPENQPSPAEIVKGLKSGDLAVMTTSARAARRILSREHNPPISMMVENGVIPPLVQALDRDDCPDLQFEAAWALTNIASGSREHTMAVVDGGAIPKLISLVAKGGSVGEQSAWALGNIAGDGPMTRDEVLAHGALAALLPMLDRDTPTAQLRTAVWTYSNLCRNKNPMVNFEQVAPALPQISQLLDQPDQDVLTDACWALSYLTDGPNDRIEAVQLTEDLLPRLVKLLDHTSPAVKTPALRALGNMLTGSDEQTDRCIAAGCAPCVVRLLACGRPGLVKEAAWAISNMFAGTTPQIQAALDAGALAGLVAVLTAGDVKSQKEAAWAITNLCLGGTPPQLDALMASGFLESYCALLESPDHRAVSVVLDGLTNLIQAAEKYGQVEALSVTLEEMGALDKIEHLQTHENEQIYKKALHIIETYFADNEDDVSQPQKAGEEFAFGTNGQGQVDYKF